METKTEVKWLKTMLKAVEGLPYKSAKNGSQYRWFFMTRKMFNVSDSKFYNDSINFFKQRKHLVDVCDNEQGGNNRAKYICRIYKDREEKIYKYIANCEDMSFNAEPEYEALDKSKDLEIEKLKIELENALEENKKLKLEIEKLKNKPQVVNRKTNDSLEFHNYLNFILNNIENKPYQTDKNGNTYKYCYLNNSICDGDEETFNKVLEYLKSKKLCYIRKGNEDNYVCQLYESQIENIRKTIDKESSEVKPKGLDNLLASAKKEELDKLIDNFKKNPRLFITKDEDYNRILYLFDSIDVPQEYRINEVKYLFRNSLCDYAYTVTYIKALKNNPYLISKI